MKNAKSCIIALVILLILSAGCSGNKKAIKTDAGDYLNSLVEKVISFQYGNEDIIEADIFTKEFIDKIHTEQIIYKEHLNPYRILSSNIEDVKDKTDDSFEIYVRVEDKQGGYFQVLHVTKINERYYVDNIEYDI